MLDIKLLRKDPKAFEKKLKSKDPDIDLQLLLKLDEELRKVISETEELKAKLNKISKEIGEKKQKKEDASQLLNEVGGLKEAIPLLQKRQNELEEGVTYQLSLLPNLPDESVLVSLDKKDNVCIKTYLEKPSFSFPTKNHIELGESLSLFDFPRGVKIAASNFPAYRGLGARLEWALLNYMMDIHLENGFLQWMVPHLVKEEILFGSGQLPKFQNQAFHLQDEEYNLYLLPTAEVALNGLHYDEILEEGALPLKYFAYTPCFRREAGAAGTQERGLIRTHQFNKVEMFAFTTPEQSEEMFREMVAAAESILQGLNLHYRNMLLVTGDTSFAASKTIDIEVWLPGQNRYYEVSSISLCTDFQARRSKIRFRRKQEKPEFVYTLNGSGLATSRLMVALLENNQAADGTVTIPMVLHKYLNGIKTLS